MDFMSKSSNSCAFMGFMSIHEVHEQIIEFMSIYGFHSGAFMDSMSKS